MNTSAISFKDTSNTPYQYGSIPSDLESNRSQVDNKITNVRKATIQPSIFVYENWNEESKNRCKACITVSKNCAAITVTTSLVLGYLGLMWYLITHADPDAIVEAT